MAICCNGSRWIPIRTAGNVIYVPIVYRQAPGGVFYRWEGGTNYASYSIASGQFSVHPQIINPSRAKIDGGWRSSVYVENMATMMARMASGGMVAQKNGSGTVTTTACSYSNNILTPQFTTGQINFSYDGYKMSSTSTGTFRATLQSGNPWNRAAGAQFRIHAYYLVLVAGTATIATDPLVCNVKSLYGSSTGDNDCTLPSSATLLNTNGTNKLYCVKTSAISASLSSDNPHSSSYPTLQFQLQYVDMPRLKITLYNSSLVSVFGCGMELFPYDYP